MASSMDAIPTEALETLVECSVCLGRLNNPRTLPCFHSFCRCCLEKFVQGCRDRNENPQLNTFQCPDCRSEFTLNPQVGVEGIRTSYLVRNMLDVMAVENPVKGIPCHHCQKVSAGRCVNCEVFLCKGCIQAHNNYLANQNHSMLSMEELSKPENRSKIRGKSRCREHDDEILKFFCETCDELICRDCKDDNHKNHECSLLKKAAERKTEELKKLRAMLTDELNEINEALQAMNNAEKVLEKNVKVAKMRIQKRRDEILADVTKNLDEKVKSLTDNIDAMHEAKSEAIKKQTDKAQTNVNEVKNAIEVCNSLLDNPNDEEIVTTVGVVETNVGKVKDDRQGNLKLVNDNSIPLNQCSTNDVHLEMQNLLKKLGSITDQDMTDIKADSKEKSPFERSSVFQLDDLKIPEQNKEKKRKLPFIRKFQPIAVLRRSIRLRQPANPSSVRQEVDGITEGNQPDGIMNVKQTYHSSLSGYEGFGYYTITYHIPSGKQDTRHPNPGHWFTGTVRNAYLPASKEGEVVLKLLQKAFDKKLIFTVGRSKTSGRENCITWNGIHHKTSMAGGRQRFGYPDPDYLRTVTDELKAKGIVPE